MQEEVSMTEKQGRRIWVNRFIWLVAGGLIVFAIMSLAVVPPVKSEKEDLAKQLDEVAKQLDEVQHGAARLLAEAKVLAESESYDDALSTLDTLFEKQPASAQVVEGRKLYAEIEIAVRAKEQKWEDAVGPIRAAWEKATAAELLAKAERAKQLVETNMAETLINEWEKVEDQIRQDWEKQLEEE
jgi:predicted Zn-dependent protease